MSESTASIVERGSRATRRGSATRTTVRVLGVLAALAGIEHGIGEVAQGWTAPPAVAFESWPDTAAFEPLDGEPAMSLLPRLLVSGILSISTAMALGVTALRTDREHCGRDLVALSVVLLLVGGGFGPPVVGLLAGLLALRARAGSSRPPGRVSQAVARTYPWPLVVAAACFLGLVPGTALVRLVVEGDLALLVTALGLGAFAGTGLAMWSARARDRLEDAYRTG